MISKKIFKSVAGFFAAVLSVTAINVYASDKAAEYQKSKAWCIAGEYPVTPESPEWASMSYAECLEACKMPEEKLLDISTEELSEYVLEYPLLADILAFDTAEQAISHLSDTSNIFREFFSRENSTEILLEKYDLLNVDYELLSRSSSDNPMTESGYTKELFLQTFFVYSLNELSDYEENYLIKIMNDKYTAKNGFCEDYSTSLLFYELVERNYAYVPSNIVIDNASDLFESLAASTGFTSAGLPSMELKNRAYYTLGKYTKYNCSSVCFRYDSGDLSSSEIENIDKVYANNHPSWTKQYSATKKYNCHSYAWLISLPSNIYWLNNPDPYANSSSFDCNGTNCSANAGDIIIIRENKYTSDGYSGATNALHSLIATSYGAGITSIQTESKLGYAGVYTAPLYDMMIFYGGASYNVYR